MTEHQEHLLEKLACDPLMHETEQNAILAALGELRYLRWKTAPLALLPDSAEPIKQTDTGLVQQAINEAIVASPRPRINFREFT